MIIGGGPGGTTCATHAARLGAHVTLIEKDIVGGAAHLLDCIPSKAMIATGGAMALMKHAQEMGLARSRSASISMLSESGSSRSNRSSSIRSPVCC